MGNTLPPNGIIHHDIDYCHGRLTNEQFLASASKKFTYLTKYTTSTEKILCKCKNCGEKYLISPDKLMDKNRFKNGCAKCSKLKMSKKMMLPFDEFEKRVYQLGYEGWKFENYNGLHAPIIGINPKGIKKQFCYAEAFLSKSIGINDDNRSNSEDELFLFVKQLCPNAISGDRSVLPSRANNTNNPELDILIRDQNVAIEFDGLYTHSITGLQRREEKKKNKMTLNEMANYHLWKTERCYDNGVFLIHIFEDEWIEHKDIVKDKISSALKIPCKTIYARKTMVKMLSSSIAAEFLDRNHIQGRCKARWHIGLIYEGEIIAVQSFNQLRSGLGGGPDNYQLDRYATKIGTRVVGGFTKALTYFERMKNPKLMVSYGDLRWTNRYNNVYIKNGFVEVRKNNPGYWYVKNKKRYHRFNYNKAAIKRKLPEVYDDNKTEREMMEEAKFHRIYDCGTIRYEKQYKDNNNE